MEATVGLLEAARSTCWRRTGSRPWLVNAKDVKHLPGPAQDRPARRGVAVQGRRTADAAAQLRAAAADPAAAGPDPVPGRPGRRADRGEEPGGEAARRRPDQAVRGGLGHLRGLRAGHDGRADRRANATRRCWPSWPGPGCAPRSPLLEEAFVGQFTDHHAFLLTHDARPHRRSSAPTSPTSRPGSRQLIAPFAARGGPAR